jgi:hypothetical protein
MSIVRDISMCRDISILIDRDISMYRWRYIDTLIDRDISILVDRDISILIYMYPSRHRYWSIEISRYIETLIDRDISICIHWDIYINRDVSIAHHRSLSWASQIQFTPPASLPKIHSDPILLRLGLPSGLFPSGFPTKSLTFLLCPMRTTCPEDEYKLWSNFLLSPVVYFLLGTLSNKIFRLMDWHLISQFHIPSEKVNFVFPAFCLISVLPE